MRNFLKGLLNDFLYIYTPFAKKTADYAFIVHPRDYHDITNNLPFLKKVPQRAVIKILRFFWPFVFSKIKGLKSMKDGRELTGIVIGVPILAHELMERKTFAKRKIAQAVKLAEKRGARIIGLGALTGSITGGGDDLPYKHRAHVTAGRAYTTHTVYEYIQDAIRTFGLIKEDTVIAIVGAAGGVGSAVAKMLAKEPFEKLILIDLERKTDKLRTLLKTIASSHIEITISSHIREVKEADIIVAATNAPEAVIEAEDPKPGAIIIDDAQPSDISPEVTSTRDDIIIIEAGVIFAKGIHFGKANFRLSNEMETYCCLGEVMALAAAPSEHPRYRIGDITPDVIETIAALGKQLGFSLAQYQSFGRIVPRERINNIKNIIASRSRIL